MSTTTEIAAAGLNRFYDEGFTRWPEEKLRPLFSNADIESEAIQQELARWQEMGWIELPRRKDVYLIVHAPIG